MTDLNEFRRALQTPDPDLRPLDLTTIMTAGARVRRRRRLTVGAGSGLAVLVLLIGGGQLARSSAPGPAPLAPGPATVGSPSGTATPDRTRSSAGSAQPVEEALGDVVHTGVRAGRAEWIIYMLPVETGQLPETTIGVKAVRLLPNGTLQGTGYLGNETDGSDRTPGFHAGSAAQNIDDVDQPAFGYYVGRPDRITGKAGGRTVIARHVPWSEDPAVTIWWFDLDDAPPGTELGSLAAYDDNGEKMPAGNPTVAAG